MKQTILELLDKQNDAHLKLMYEVRTHPDVASRLRGPPPKNYEQHVKYLIDTAKNRVFFIIKADRTPCGYCHITIGCREIELGWALHPLWWGQSIGSAAVKLLVEHVQVAYSMEKIVLFVKKDNTPAIHIYKKNGFVIQGFDNLTDEYFMCLSIPT